MSKQEIGATRLRIGDQLIREGLITQAQLDEALAEQQRKGGKIVSLLAGLGYIDQRAFLAFLSRQPGIASINLPGYRIPTELLALIPAEFARQHEVVPMDRMGADLTVGMACPLDVEVINELAAMTGLRVRALLVAPDAIQTVLDRYYPTDSRPEPVELPAPLRETALDAVSAALTFDSVMALVRSVESLPTLPDTIQRVQAAVENPDVGAREVADILKSDPALSAKVISLANAPAHGFKHRVESIEAATALLGLRDVYSVTLSAAVVSSFGASVTFDYEAFWRRSTCCANLAKILSRTGGLNVGMEAFAAGLLHDIGRAVFAEVVPGAYAALDHRATDAALIDAEHATFGIAHPEVGYVVTRNWGIPPTLTDAIRFHHCPERAVESPALAELVALAAGLTDHLENPGAIPLQSCVAVHNGALTSLGIETDQLASILDIARALRENQL